MTGRASEKNERPTIMADRKDEEESLHKSFQPTCEDHDKSNESVSSKGGCIENKTKSNENRKCSRFERMAAGFGSRWY
jgi:hypothetical protein